MTLENMISSLTRLAALGLNHNRQQLSHFEPQFSGGFQAFLPDFSCALWSESSPFPESPEFCHEKFDLIFLSLFEVISEVFQERPWEIKELFGLNKKLKDVFLV